jgi:hypothetical protein
VKNYDAELHEIKVKEEKMQRDGKRYANANEMKQSNDALKTDIHRKQDKRKRELYELELKKNQAKENFETWSRSVVYYTELEKERRRFLTYEYMKLNPTDIEEMVVTLNQHFITI